MVNVTFNNFHNVYTYSPVKLWLAYGLAIFFTTVAAALGLLALVSNGASHSLDFSAIFLVARGSTISEEPTSKDMAGEDPLSDRLAKSKVLLSGSTYNDEVRGEHPEDHTRPQVDTKATLLDHRAVDVEK